MSQGRLTFMLTKTLCEHSSKTSLDYMIFEKGMSVRGSSILVLVNEGEFNSGTYQLPPICLPTVHFRLTLVDDDSQLTDELGVKSYLHLIYGKFSFLRTLYSCTPECMSTITSPLTTSGRPNV